MRAGLTQTGISHVSGLEISALLLRPYRKAPDEEAKVTDKEENLKVERVKILEGENAKSQTFPGAKIWKMPLRHRWNFTRLLNTKLKTNSDTASSPESATTTAAQKLNTEDIVDRNHYWSEH